MPRYHSDETDGPAGQRDSLRRYYGGQPPQANRKVGSPWDTTGRDDSRRRSDALRSESEDSDMIITDEEFERALGGAQKAAERRGAADDGDDGDGDTQPRMRVRCPDCGSRVQVAPPDGMTLAEVEDEDEEEAEDVQRVRAQCPECEAKFEVAPPKGYAFQDEEEDEEEDEDEREDARDIADTTKMSERGRRRAAEVIVSRFFHRYRGRVLRESLARRRRSRRSTGSNALDAFLESYRDEMKFRRRGAMPE